ncbi:MAG: hypothetical protein M3O70_15010 [Actinomycetota bacterium]|nr:hypothetical protein [Actinomycetota bacterium]
MRSRPGGDLTARFPEVAAALEGLPAGAVLDGELVVLGENGRPDFEQVRRRLAWGDGARGWAERPATLIVFDVLAYRGSQTFSAPWFERRGLLDRLPLNGTRVVRCPWYEDGSALWEAVVAQRLEGVVAKRCDAAYCPGRRTRHWIKTKHTADSGHVIVGVDERPERRAYLVAREQGDGSLAYAGRVELVDPHVRRDLDPSLKSIPASPIGWRTRRVRWVTPDTHVIVRALASGPRLREGRIVALAR